MYRWLCMLLFLFNFPIHANDSALPKFEAGFAAGAFWLPDYPASERVRERTLALPYGIYRGDFIRADREGGLRGRFFKRDRMDLSLSASAAFPANSEDNESRRGMPDLDWIGEIGPKFIYFFVKSPLVSLNLSLPLRFVFSTDFNHFQERGYTFNPEVQFRHRMIFDQSLILSASIGSTWATENLQDYFYEVQPEYALTQRPAFDARGGYLGSDLTLSLVKNLNKNINLVVGVSQGRYVGAKNRNSPLFKDHVTESYFLGLSWSLYSSQEKESPLTNP